MIHCLVLALFLSFGTHQSPNACKVLPVLSLFLTLLLFCLITLLAMTQTAEDLPPYFSSLFNLISLTFARNYLSALRVQMRKEKHIILSDLASPLTGH